MSEIKITVEVPGLDELVAEMRKQNELLTGKSVIKSDEPTPAVENKQPESSSEDSDDSDSKVAGRRTYIFFKDTKTGTIVEKGEEVPTHDGATGVGKTKWENLCEKYDLDPETGNKREAEPEDDDEPGDDDLDLGLDDDGDDEELTLEGDVKPALIKVMKAKDRETVLKILKKYGASNVDNIKPEDYAAIKADAEKVLVA